MADMPKMEIPDAVRAAAEKNLEQARSAYGQLLDMMRKSQEQLMSAVYIEVPQLPSELNDRIDEQLDAIVMRALERDRDARTPTAQELAFDLDTWCALQSFDDAGSALAAWVEKHVEADRTSWRGAATSWRVRTVAVTTTPRTDDVRTFVMDDVSVATLPLTGIATPTPATELPTKSELGKKQRR